MLSWETGLYSLFIVLESVFNTCCFMSLVSSLLPFLVIQLGRFIYARILLDLESSIPCVGSHPQYPGEAKESCTRVRCSLIRHSIIHNIWTVAAQG